MKYGTLFEAILSLIVVLYVALTSIPFPNARSVVYVLVLYPVFNNILATVLSYLRAHSENEAYARALWFRQQLYLDVVYVLFY